MSQLLRTAEVADLFRVNPKTVAKWAREGKLQSAKTLGGQNRFLREEVIRLMAEMGIPGEPPP